MADAYEEIILLHDRVQARLEDALGEHRRRQADYDNLLVRHATTNQALAPLKTNSAHSDSTTKGRPPA